MIKKYNFVILLIVVLLIISCAPKERSAIPSSNFGPPSATSKAEPAGEWEKILSGAKKEGKVVVYTAIGGETRDVLIKAFSDKYGMDVEWVTARADALTQKLLTENKVGIHLADLYMGGSTTIANVVKPADLLAPVEPSLVLPEVLDPKVWPDGKVPFFDKERIGLAMSRWTITQLAVNTNLVNSGEIKSLRDLLEPKWKSKIIFNDPTTLGAGLKWYGVTVEKLGLDYMRKLASQEPVILRDERLQVEWLARGRYPILIAPKSDVIVDFTKAGAPIKRITPAEGGFTSAGAAHLTRLKDPAHPFAQKLFINWILTRDAQTLFSRARQSPSSRMDVTTEGLEPSLIPEPGIEYFNGDAEDFVRKEPQFREQAIEIFQQLVK